MPTLRIDYSANIIEVQQDFTPLFKELHTVMVASNAFTLSKVKSYAQCHHNYYVSDGNAACAFVALQISVLAGRSVEIRNQISQGSLAALKICFAQSLQKLKCRITVEVREINPATHNSLDSN